VGVAAWTSLSSWRSRSISFHPQPRVLLAQLGQLGPLRGGQTGAFAPVGAGLGDPVPQPALADAEAAGDIDDPVAVIEHHRHRITLETVGERAPRPRRLLLHH
jgi:hypothetical protein